MYAAGDSYITANGKRYNYAILPSGHYFIRGHMIHPWGVERKGRRLRSLYTGAVLFNVIWMSSFLWEGDRTAGHIFGILSFVLMCVLTYLSHKYEQVVGGESVLKLLEEFYAAQCRGRGEEVLRLDVPAANQGKSQS